MRVRASVVAASVVPLDDRVARIPLHPEERVEVVRVESDGEGAIRLRDDFVPLGGAAVRKRGISRRE